jgi:hypothetical protein
MQNNTVHTKSAELKLIAPCGINCSLCRAHIRGRHPCPGCRIVDEHKLVSRIRCKIKNCTHRIIGARRYCFSCNKFPCADLQRLDKRYRSKYATSPIANLERIKANGIKRFIAKEKIDWSCPKCGALLCMHQPQCVHCGRTWRK